jgi:hypothetical protein
MPYMGFDAENSRSVALMWLRSPSHLPILNLRAASGQLTARDGTCNCGISHCCYALLTSINPTRTRSALEPSKFMVTQ